MHHTILVKEAKRTKSDLVLSLLLNVYYSRQLYHHKDHHLLGT